jgi:hypothetical protein
MKRSVDAALGGAGGGNSSNRRKVIKEEEYEDAKGYTRTSTPEYPRVPTSTRTPRAFRAAVRDPTTTSNVE